MKNISRRRFLSGSAAAAATTGACICGLNGCATFTKVGSTPLINQKAYSVEAGERLMLSLEKAAQLKQDGGSVKIIDENLRETLIIARVGEEKFAVASLKCTHRGVELEYKADKKLFQCASLGGSKYNLDGSNAGGPSQKPLRIFPSRIEGSSLVVDLSA